MPELATDRDWGITTQNIASVKNCFFHPGFHFLGRPQPGVGTPWDGEGGGGSGLQVWFSAQKKWEMPSNGLVFLAGRRDGWEGSPPPTRKKEADFHQKAVMTRPPDTSSLGAAKKA